MLKQGKVRDIYELDETSLIFVTTDRISAFDHVLPNLIPDKGKILTKLSAYWFDKLEVYYHLISMEKEHLPEKFRTEEFLDRTMIVEKAEVIPFECVVRGYLTGSAYREYRETGCISGKKMPYGLKENQHFLNPLFTPTTKAESGHDINITFEQMVSSLGIDLASELEQKSIELYKEAAEIAWDKGIIIADTKFEWGLLKHVNNDLVLIDEILTPDSSRFWSLDSYEVGKSIPSFDKQYVRDWLESTGWDKNSPPPELPPEIIEKTREKYLDIYERLTNE